MRIFELNIIYFKRETCLIKCLILIKILDGNFSQDFDGKYNLLLLNVNIMLLYTGYVIYGHTSDYVTIQYLH